MVNRQQNIKNGIVTFSAKATKKFAYDLARKILKEGNQGKMARVLGLVGELGAGKTTFVQGFAAGLGIKNKILSPTFVIVKRFRIKDSRFKFKSFYHIDCYRTQSPKDLLDLGWEEIIRDSRNIVVVEWADRIKNVLSKDAILIKFEVAKRNARRIFFRASL